MKIKGKSYTLFFTTLFILGVGIFVSAGAIGEESRRPVSEEGANEARVTAVPVNGPIAPVPSKEEMAPERDIEFPLERIAIEGQRGGALGIGEKVAELADGGKAFINMKEGKATIIGAKGDIEIYSRVQEFLSETGEPVIQTEGKNLFGRLEQKVYRDGSSDIFLSSNVMATLDSEGKLVDLFMTSEGNNPVSLAAAINLAVHGSGEATEHAKQMIYDTEALDISNQPSTVREQIKESLRRYAALLGESEK